MADRDASVTAPHQSGRACFHQACFGFYHCLNQDVGGVLNRLQMGMVELGGSSWYSGWGDRSKILTFWNDGLKIKRWAVHADRYRDKY